MCPVALSGVLDKDLSSRFSCQERKKRQEDEGKGKGRKKMMKSGRNTFFSFFSSFSSFTSCSFSWNWTELWVIFRHLIPCKTEAITYIERVTGSRHTTFLIEKHKRRRRMVPRRRKKKERKNEGKRGRQENRGRRKEEGWEKFSPLTWWRQMMYCFIQERWKKIEHCTSYERTVTSFPSYFSFERRKNLNRRMEEKEMN